MTSALSSPEIQIAAFYHFASVAPEKVDELAKRLEEMGVERDLRGLIIFASEGINGTICGATQADVLEYLVAVSSLLDFPRLDPKWSEAPSWPFKKFRVRVREEIVTLGKPEVQPLAPKSPTHLSPEEWNRAMEEDDTLVLDTRNWYETRIGKFTGAIDPKISEFQNFGTYLEESGIPKDKKVLIYCTGGIRCEKALVEMNNKGFSNVYQLDGGILNYLAQFPNQKFEGECFVFDHRVAVDQNLKPTTFYKMCPHCGQPADQTIQCLRCDQDALVCVECIEKPQYKTCSKNCSYHYEIAPGKKGRSQHQGYRFVTIGKARSARIKPAESAGGQDPQQA